MKVWARTIMLVVTLLGFAAFLNAATPPSGTINTPTDNTLGTKQTLTYTAGPFAGGTTAGTQTSATVAVCLQAVTPPGLCDVFTLNVNLPGDYWQTHKGDITAKIEWASEPDGNDLDLYIVDELDRIVASSTTDNSASASETAIAPNPGPRTYRVVIVNWLTVVPISTVNGTVTFNLVPQTTPPPPTAVLFENHQPPIINGTQAGRDALEPTIGANWDSGNVMYLSGLETFRVSFDDTTVPATANWTDVSAAITSVETLDPILYTDFRTGRTFVSQLYGGCSLLAFTDDDGANWFQNPIGCGLAAFVDHQTVGGGPWAPGMSSVDPIFNYKNSVFYCAQDVASAQCASSVTGGIVFNPGIPAYTALDCGGLHGHIRSGFDGTLYLPNASCFDANGDSRQGVVVSTNNGLTWTVRTVPGSLPENSDPYVDVGPNGTVYFSWTDGTGHPFAAVSRDRGATWTDITDIGASMGIQNSVFPTVVVGDDDRAAAAFIGTTEPGGYQSATFPGLWYMFVALTYDGGKTWTTYNATPNDPVQRGCIWTSGGSNPCRNLLDFFGITVDKFGRVLVGYADGCIDDPLNANNRCISNPPADVRDTIRTRIATIARQSAGNGLFAQHDGQIFKTVPGTPVLTGLAGNGVNHLNWSTPSNGGAAITNYKIYRGTASGQETLLTTVGNVNSFDDTGVINDTTYFYRVSAVNAVGEGLQSNEISLTPRFAAAPSAPQRLKTIGKKGGVLLTWSAPTDSGTAAITNYKIYRGTTSATKTLLTTTGNETKFADNNVTAGTTYFYQVSAVNSVGEGPRANEDSAKPK